MIRIIAAIFLLFCTNLSFSQNLIIYKSDKSVEETARALIRVIEEKEMIFFEVISYDSIAKARNVRLAPTRSILFEDPELTMKLLLCQQTVAHDLPLEILVWEENQDVYVGFMDTNQMLRRFMLEGCEDILDQLSRLMIRVTMDALRQL